MISKLRFSLVAVLMLVLLGFGFQNQAQSQVGDGGLFCPAVPNTTGWLEVNVEAGLGAFPNFSGQLIGSVDSLLGGPLHGGMDWGHVDTTSIYAPTPTNDAGAQLVSWWTQKDGRNSYLQVTNAIDSGTWVHVHIFDENCLEIRDFCDFYTEFDTHVYNFGDLISNNGTDVPDGNIQGKEGFVTVTATNECPTPGQAYDHNYLTGNTFIKSVTSGSEYLYGFANYHRNAVCFDIPGGFVDVNLIANGSFEDPLGSSNWTVSQGNGARVSNANISPDIDIPPASGPDAGGGDAYVGFAASSSTNGTQTENYQYLNLDIEQLINSPQGGAAPETNVSIVSSNAFTPTESGTVFYDVSLLQPSDSIVPAVGISCDNYVAVCVVDVDDESAAFLHDCRCYNNEGSGNINSDEANRNCQILGSDNVVYNVDSAAGNFTFDGGLSGFATNEELSVDADDTYRAQFITGQINNLACSNGAFNANTGTFVDNFRKIEQEELEPDLCVGILDGSENKMLADVVPGVFAGQFDAQSGEAGADVVHINFYDEYEPVYTPQAAFINAVVGIWNDVEVFDSCGEAEVCFVRLGIDEALILSDNFDGPPTTAPPTTAPTLGPTVTPTVAPTTTPGGNGGSGSCAIAGSPVQLGTAFANVLIPLIPVAFVFGIRAMRRRNK